LQNETQNPLLNVAEIELVYRSPTKPSERPKVMNSKDAYDILLSTWDMDKIELAEQFKILLLDRGSRCMGVSTLASGGITGCVADLSLAFATAIKARASSIIIAHNHPSGNLQQSVQDEKLTKKFSEAGKILDISVHDHLIVTREGYTSFADGGLMT